MPDVFPDSQDLPVRVVRNRTTGALVGFQDPGTGRFLSRTDAIARLQYSPERGQVEDSFANPVGVGSLGIPARGQHVTFKVKEADYQRLSVDVNTFKPSSNQEIVERTVLVTKEGKLVTSETSYGLGQKYQEGKYGGRWRQEASEALGTDKKARLPTKDLERAVAYREFIVKTIS